MFSESRSRGGGWAPRSKNMPASQRKGSQSIDELPLGPCLSIITHNDLEIGPGFDRATAVIHSCEYIASYSWIDAKSATIMVPGKPPLWLPPSHPRQLKPDSGDFYRDPNAARFPQYPTEPAVQAVLTQNEDIDTGDIDIFACASTLGNLLRFARNIDKAFRFNVELIGNTVFFVRKESSPTALIEGVRGYGHTFPEAYTTWEADVKRSISHQRIVKYNLAGLNCIVRFGCDGYHKDLIEENNQAEPKRNFSTNANVADELEELSVASGNAPTDISSAESSLLIKEAGKHIPQKAVFDIKTKHGKYPIDMSEIYPRLWVCQIPNFVLAYHDRAVFSDIRKQDLRREISEWEDDNNEALCKLVVLMRKIISYAVDNSEVKLEVMRKEGENLEIRERANGGHDALPQTTKVKWTAHMDVTLPQPVSPQGTEDLEDDEVEPDYTACSEDCGYCGRCTY